MNRAKMFRESGDGRRSARAKNRTHSLRWQSVLDEDVQLGGLDERRLAGRNPKSCEGYSSQSGKCTRLMRVRGTLIVLGMSLLVRDGDFNTVTDDCLVNAVRERGEIRHVAGGDDCADSKRHDEDCSNPRLRYASPEEPPRHDTINLSPVGHRIYA